MASSREAGPAAHLGVHPGASGHEGGPRSPASPAAFPPPFAFEKALDSLKLWDDFRRSRLSGTKAGRRPQLAGAQVSGACSR